MTDNYILKQRKVIGIFTFLLPILSILGTFLNPANPYICRASISDTYYTNARVIFIGIASIISFFLCTYNPYQEKFERILNCITGIGLVIIAVFPCTPFNGALDTTNLFMLPQKICIIIHTLGALALLIGFFMIITINFPKGDKTNPQKRTRNIVYRVVSVICASMLVFYALGFFGVIKLYNYIYIAEICSLIPMSIAWLTKAEFFGFLNDK